jgi:hypothetical protein
MWCNLMQWDAKRSGRRPQLIVTTFNLRLKCSSRNYAAGLRDWSLRGAFFGADAGLDGVVLLFVASFFGFLFSGSPPAAALFSLFSPDDVRLA